MAWLGTILAIFLLLTLGVSTGLVSRVHQQTLITIFINIILAIGLNLIVGFSGQLALGHAGFMAIGAYATGIITRQTPTLGGFFLSLLVGIVLAEPLSSLFALFLLPSVLSVSGKGKP